MELGQGSSTSTSSLRGPDAFGAMKGWRLPGKAGPSAKGVTVGALIIGGLKNWWSYVVDLHIDRGIDVDLDMDLVSSHMGVSIDFGPY